MAIITDLVETSTLGSADETILRQTGIDKRISLELAGTLSWAKRNGYNYIGAYTTGVIYNSLTDFTLYEGVPWFTKSTTTLPYTTTTSQPSLDSDLRISTDKEGVGDGSSPVNAIPLNTLDLDTLNTYEDAGYYYQTSDSNTSGNNYPTTYSGSLVITKGVNGVVQSYSVFNTGDLYSRTYSNTGWSGWIKFSVEGGNGVNVREDLGAIGDGTLHELSEIFTTVAEAQTVYPDATDLSESIDRLAIQTALNGRGEVFIPAGEYYMDKKVRAQGATRVVGENNSNSLSAVGDGASVLVYQESTSDGRCIEFIDTLATSNRVEDFHMSDIAIRNRGILHKGSALQLHTSAEYMSRSSFTRVNILDFNKGVDLHHAWMTSFDNMMVDISPSSADTCFEVLVGTSITMRNCYASGGKTGFRLRTVYSSLFSCGADRQSVTSYEIQAGSVTLYSCGSEFCEGYIFTIGDSSFSLSNSANDVVIKDFHALMTETGSGIIQNWLAGKDFPLDAIFEDCSFVLQGDGQTTPRPANLKGDPGDYYAHSIQFVNSWWVVDNAAGRSERRNIMSYSQNIEQGNVYWNRVMIHCGPTRVQALPIYFENRDSKRMFAIKFNKNQNLHLEMLPLSANDLDYKRNEYVQTLKLTTDTLRNVFIKDNTRFSTSQTHRIVTVDSDLDNLYVIFEFSIDLENTIGVKVLEGQVEVRGVNNILDNPFTLVTAISPV